MTEKTQNNETPEPIKAQDVAAKTPEILKAEESLAKATASLADADKALATEKEAHTATEGKRVALETELKAMTLTKAEVELYEKKKLSDERIAEAKEKAAAKLLEDDAKALAADKKKYPYGVLAPHSVTTPRGIKVAGEGVREADFGGGKQALEAHVKNGVIKKR